MNIRADIQTSIYWTAPPVNVPEECKRSQAEARLKWVAYELKEDVLNLIYERFNQLYGIEELRYIKQDIQ